MNQNVIVESIHTINLNPSVTGFLPVISLPLLGSRGQLLAIKVRQLPGGVVTTADFYIAQNPSSSEPPGEATTWKKTAVTLTPDAHDVAVAEFPSLEGEGWYYSDQNLMGLVVNIAAVSEAAASQIIVSIFSKRQP